MPDETATDATDVTRGRRRVRANGKEADATELPVNVLQLSAEVNQLIGANAALNCRVRELEERVKTDAALNFLQFVYCVVLIVGVRRSVSS